MRLRTYRSPTAALVHAELQQRRLLQQRGSAATPGVPIERYPHLRRVRDGKGWAVDGGTW
jgi:hypothetical protein